MAKSKDKKQSLKQGILSDEEKRTIEQLIKFETFASIAKKLNRNPTTIRKWCQRNGITKDKSSVSKRIEEKKKRSPHFEELSNILTDREMDLGVKIYTELMRQFGGDILPSEEIQVIDFVVVSAMLNRAMAREKEISKLIEQQSNLRDILEKERGSIEDDDDDGRQGWYEKIDAIDMKIGSLNDDLKETKKNQLAFLVKKENFTKAMNASRDQRRDELAKMNENWADFVMYLKNNVEFRTKLGLELERNRLAIKEEFIRLSQLHQYADGEFDYPVYNSEVSSLENENNVK